LGEDKDKGKNEGDREGEKSRLRKRDKAMGTNKKGKRRTRCINRAEYRAVISAGPCSSERPSS